MIEQNTQKVIYLLVGAKGSGKTYLGRLLAREFDIEFLEVEKRLIEYIASSEFKSEQLPKDGYEIEEKWISEALQSKDEVISEATGSSKYLSEFISQLKAKYSLRLIRVKCPLETCFRRLKKRPKTDQFVVSDYKIKSINNLSHNLKLDWVLEIDNSGTVSELDIAAAFAKLRVEIRN